MLSKKGFSLLLAVIMFASLTTSAFGQMLGAEEKMLISEVPYEEPEQEPEIKRDQALEIGKKALTEYLGINVDTKKYQSNMQYRRDWENPNLLVWSMQWNYNDHLEYSNVSITINAFTGEILEMSKDDGKYGDTTPRVTTITREEAQAKAEAFINKMKPGILSETKLTNNMEEYHQYYGGPYPLFYHFNYVRIIDGVKYDSNYINVGMDGATGEIRNFAYRWETITKLPPKEGIISIAEANKIYRENIRLDLIYLPIRDEFNYQPLPKSIKLAYRPAYDFANMIDAKTGKAIGWNGKEQEQQMQMKDLNDKEKEAIYSKSRPVTKQPNEISREKAEALALAVIKAEIGEEAKIQHSSYIEGDSHWEAAGRKAWEINFTIEKKDSQQSTAVAPVYNGRVLIDALTEEILAINNWHYQEFSYGQTFEPVITWEEAYDKAVKLIEKYHPGKIMNLNTRQTYVKYSEFVDGREIPPMEYYFNFTRKEAGAVYEDNQINVSYNTKTGMLQNFNCRWQENLSFPSTEQAISADEAKNILFTLNELELAYFRYNTTNDYQNPVFDTKLIYRFVPKRSAYTQYMLLDAVTGNPINYNGQPISIDQDNDFENLVKGHWVEKSARILAQQGILDRNIFKPDEKINKLDAVKILVKARGMDYYYPMREEADKLKFSDISEDSPDYRYIQMAMRYGIIENKEGKFNGEANISREEFAVMVVKLLRYDTLAKAKNIFKLSFKDENKIASDLIGYVAICQGLEIISSEQYRIQTKGYDNYGRSSSNGV
jgi:hypothetical protein